MTSHLADNAMLQGRHKHLLQHVPESYFHSLVFDNVLLVPSKSLPSRDPKRGGPDITGKFSRNILLKVPLVSANMNSVTESRMAIAMARLGGIGVLHRFCTIEEEVRMVSEVKRAEGFKISDPYTIHQDATLKEALDFMRAKNVSGLLVRDDQKHLVGIFTHRDIPLYQDEKSKIKILMTPRSEMVVGSANITLEEAAKMFASSKKEKIPLVQKNDVIAGLVTRIDVEKMLFYKDSTKDAQGRLKVAAAIGVTEDEKERAGALIKAGADALVVDIANGYSNALIEMVRYLKSVFPVVDVVAGNVATYQAAKELIAAGADSVKVGIGPGAACKTREQTGFGVSQISAILQAATAAGNEVPLIADGGVRKPGDAVKALAAGASSVMMGGVFAGTDESPGLIIDRGARGKFKGYQGMASYRAALDRLVRSGEGIDLQKFHSLDDVTENTDEGVSGEVKYSGPVAKIFKEFSGGIRSAYSYGASRTLEEFQKNVQFVYQTESGAKESAPHDMSY